MQYQNRLRHREYLALFEDEGFEVVDAETSGGSAEDLRTLRTLGLPPRFRKYRDEDLAVRTALVTLRVA